MFVDQFYKKIQDLINLSYLPQSNVVDYLPFHNQSYKNLKAALTTWHNNGFKWPELAYNQNRNPSQAYKKSVITEIKKTLTALRNFIEDSGIFSEKEKAIKGGVYQKLMTVLDTPIELTPIKADETNKKGIFLRDLANNHMYWGLPGSHIQLLRDLSNVFERIMQISLDKEALELKKEDIQFILSSLFPHDDLDRYGVCPGSHTFAISNAKVLLPRSPEDVLLSYWNKFKSKLITENIPSTVSIYDSTSPNIQVHIPPAIDYIFGVSRDLINNKDAYMHLSLNSMNTKQLKYLAENIFKFHDFLIEEISKEIDSVMDKFDTLNISDQNKKINTLWTSIISPFVKENDQFEEFTKLVFDENTLKFLSSVDIKQKSKALLAKLIFSTTLGMEETSFEDLLSQEISNELRIESFPKDFNCLKSLFLFYAENENVDVLKKIVSNCHDDLRTSLFGSLLFEAVSSNNKDVISKVINVIPDHLKNEVFDFAIAYIHCIDLPEYVSQNIITLLQEHNLTSDQMLRNNLIEKVLSDNFTNDKLKNYFKDEIPNESKIEVASDLLLILLQSVNYETFQKTQNIIGRNDVMRRLFCHALYSQDTISMHYIIAVSSKELIKNTLLDSISKEDHFTTYNLLKLFPEISGEVLGDVLFTLVEEKSNFINDLIDKCSDELRLKMFFDALVKSMIYNRDDITIPILDACPDVLKSKVFGEIFCKYLLEGQFAVVGYVQANCNKYNDGHQIEMYGEALYKSAIIDVSNQSTNCIIRHYSDIGLKNDKVYIYALRRALINSDVDVSVRLLSFYKEEFKKRELKKLCLEFLETNDISTLNTTLRACPQELKESLFVDIMKACVSKEDTKHLSNLMEAGLDEFKQSNLHFSEHISTEILNTTLLSAVGNNDRTSVAGLLEFFSNNFDKETFGQALLIALNNSSFSIRDKIIEKCENSKHLRSIFGHALLGAALSEDSANSMQQVLAFCPNELKPQMFCKALLYADKNKESNPGHTQALENIANLCPEEMKPKVREHVLRYCMKTMNPKKAWNTSNAIQKYISHNPSNQVNTSADSCPNLRNRLPLDFKSFTINRVVPENSEIQSARDNSSSQPPRNHRMFRR